MVVKVSLPRGGGTTAVFGLFSRASPQERKAQLEDVSLTLKQKQRELREVERLIEELKRKTEAAANLDQHILEQQKILAALQSEAQQRLKEFKKEESTFRAREARILAAEQEIQGNQALVEEKRRLLAEKEEALLQREDVIEARKQHAEQLEDSIKHATVPFEHRSKRLAALIETQEQKLAQLHQERTRSEHELTERTRTLNRLEARTRELTAAGKALERTHALLGKKAEGITAKEQDIRKREKQLQRYRNTEEESKRIIQQALQTQAEAQRAVGEKKRYVEDVRNMIAENNQKLEQLRATERHIAEMQHQVEDQHKDATEKLQEIDRKEKNVLKREMDWLDHQNAFKETLEDLRKTKDEIETTVAERKAELANLQQEWDVKAASLRDERDFLSTQKTDLQRLVKADLAALKEKEQEILSSVKAFEQDQLKLDKEENAVLGRVKQLEKEQKIVQQLRMSIADRESRVVEQEKTAKKILAAADQVKQLRKELPALRREAAQLTREITRLEQMGARRGAVRIAPARAVTRREERIAHERPARISTKPQATAKDELQEMIESARNNVQSGNVTEALKILTDLEQAARKLNEEDRRQLAYEIRDIKTSIKLAML